METQIKTDIESEEDVALMVHTFYANVRKDEILAPIFNEHITDWAKHLQIMCDFWSTLLLYTRRYLNDPMTKHLSLPIKQEHFEHWLALFQATVDELFEGNNANAAKVRAANIARIMQNVIERNEKK